MQWQKKSINSLIEDAILEADKRGSKVLSLGLMNQASDIGKNVRVMDPYPCV